MLLVAAVATLAAGCGSFGNTTRNLATAVAPYKIEVVQGNFVSREQVEALQQGMTREQVRGVLGTPLVASVFHANRWDYVFTLKRQGAQAQARRLSVFFEGDLLERFEGDTMPSETEFVAQLDTRRKFGKPPALEASEAALQRFDAARKPGNAATTRDGTAAAGDGPDTDGTAASAPAAPVVYPPLEAAPAAR